MIGLLPAAGKAERIHGIPKFLLPVEDTYLLDWHTRAMLKAGCAGVAVGTHVNNAYLVQQYAQTGYVATKCATMTETVLSSDLHTSRENVLFGMPDSYWTDRTVYKRLSEGIAVHDILVAVFYARPGQHKQGGMVRFDDMKGYQITEVVDKPEETDLKYIWGAMAWRTEFWAHMQPSDPHIGYALPRAIEAGMDVRAVVCVGEYFDCGSPERYFAMIRETT